MDENQTAKIFTTPLLVGLLVVAAFFVGTLYTKVQFLEKGGKVAGQQDVAKAGANPNTDTAPAQPEGPTEDTLKKVPAVDNNDHIRGNKNAKVVLVEYSDFECPFCSRFNTTMQQVMTDYKDQVAWVYRHFPLSFHASAQKYAEASECITELGGNDGFWKFSDALYKKVEAGGMDASKLQALAVELGFNGASFQQCLDGGKYAQKVKDQATAGQSAGIEGTPGTIIISKDGKYELIPGALPIDQVKPMLDKYVK